MNNQEKATLVWPVADNELFDEILRKKYQDFILPFSVFRRLDIMKMEA